MAFRPSVKHTHTLPPKSSLHKLSASAGVKEVSLVSRHFREPGAARLQGRGRGCQSHITEPHRLSRAQLPQTGSSVSHRRPELTLGFGEGVAERFSGKFQAR